MNIEDIQVGDFVYSYNTLTGELELKEVTAVFSLVSDHINYITIVDENGNTQVIETTDGHPFWVVTDEPDLERAAQGMIDENGAILHHNNIAPTEHGFWVEAKDLREGDVFLGANGELSTVVSVERVEFPDGIAVYNLTVDGNHNYFVIAACDEYGQTSVLVHNAQYGDGQPSLHARPSVHAMPQNTPQSVQAILNELVAEGKWNAGLASHLQPDEYNIEKLREVYVIAVARMLALGVPERLIRESLHPLNNAEMGELVRRYGFNVQTTIIEAGRRYGNTIKNQNPTLRDAGVALSNAIADAHRHLQQSQTQQQLFIRDLNFGQRVWTGPQGPQGQGKLPVKR